MPPPFLRPFPFPALSIGTDIAHVPRIARLVASPRTLPRFLRKVLTAREERDFHLRFSLLSSSKAASVRDGNHHNDKSRDVQTRRPGAVEGEGEGKDVGDHSRWVEGAAKFLAGRWAAKEAVVKACSWRRLMFDEIMVLREEGGKRVYGVILDEREVGREEEEDGVRLREEPAGQVVKLSISHDGEYATAVCLAADESSLL